MNRATRAALAPARAPPATVPVMTTPRDTDPVCPRCFETLRVTDTGPERERAALLACPEPYCDYVLVLTEREAFSARKWSWPDLFRFTRAAG